ncbi:MAG: diaminobutyrate--2-oxoglutarate transaminase [Arenicellales bacterium]
MNSTIDRYESRVRSYCRSFDATFDQADGAWLRDTDGNRYLDFLAGAGALNYGHNPPELKRRLLEYIERGGITHSLDLYSPAKARFLQRFNDVILQPRGMDYKVQFPGPTGTNAVEAALKLARKITGRANILFFTNAFHGMTAGALAVSGNAAKRAGAGQPLANAVPMPFDGYAGNDEDSIAYLEQVLTDGGSGVDKPAAIVTETVQAEGGVNVASTNWLRMLETLCRRHEILLIVDDIQMGCGRTGRFFSFEEAGIRPDLVTLSKSLSGYGLPLSVVLIRPDLDAWAPGEHNGTFRGNNAAFVTAEAALDFWESNTITPEVRSKEPLVEEHLTRVSEDYPALQATVRGRGFIWGLACGKAGAAESISRACFERGLIMETCGTDDEVLKFLAPLTISRADLELGLQIIQDAAAATAREYQGSRTAA